MAKWVLVYVSAHFRWWGVCVFLGRWGVGFVVRGTGVKFGTKVVFRGLKRAKLVAVTRLTEELGFTTSRATLTTK